MLTFQARENAESLLDVLTGKNDAILGVKKICDVNLSVEKHLTSLLIDQNKAGNLVSGINSQLNNERKKIDEVEVSKLFISIHSLIEELKSNNFYNRSLLDEPIKELQSFNDAFEKYVRSYRPPEIANLVFSARATKKSIDNLVSALDFFLTNTSVNSLCPENNSEITIALSSEFKLGGRPRILPLTVPL